MRESMAIFFTKSIGKRLKYNNIDSSRKIILYEFKEYTYKIEEEKFEMK
jgi:hypothetical protein